MGRNSFFYKNTNKKREYAAQKRVPFNNTHHPINVRGVGGPFGNVQGGVDLSLMYQINVVQYVTPPPVH